MTGEVLVEAWTPGRRLWLKTPGRYSMDAAVQILRWVEGFEGASTLDVGWASPGCGKLVEDGITVRFANIRFSIMCSYDDLFIDRLGGDDRKFTSLGEAIRREFATARP